MSAKRNVEEEVEGPIKKGPSLVLSLVLLLIFLVITGFYLVRWYLENLKEQVASVNSGRVLLSGVAVLVLIAFTVVALVYVLGGKRGKSRRQPVRKTKSPARSASATRYASTSRSASASRSASTAKRTKTRKTT